MPMNQKSTARRKKFRFSIEITHQPEASKRAKSSLTLHCISVKILALMGKCLLVVTGIAEPYTGPLLLRSGYRSQPGVAKRTPG